MSLDAEGRTAKLQSGEEVRLRQGADRHRGAGEPAPPRGRPAGGDPLPAGASGTPIRSATRSPAPSTSCCVGGSYIGSEVAASLTRWESACTIVMLEHVIMSRGFGDEVGRYVPRAAGLERGRDRRRRDELEAFVGDERVAAIRTESGREIECDAVVIGAGVQPGHDARRAGRARGGQRDRLRLAASRPRRRGSSRPGTVLSYESELHGRRAPDRALGRRAAAGPARGAGDARGEGRLRGRALLLQRPFRLGLASSTSAAGGAWDEVVWRGDRDAGEFSAWYLSSDRVVAALSVGRPEDLLTARPADRGRGAARCGQGDRSPTPMPTSRRSS